MKDNVSRKPFPSEAAPGVWLVPLTQGLVAKIDASDAGLVGEHTWWADKRSRNRTSQRFTVLTRVDLPDGKWANLKLHRLLMNAPSGLVVDHINGDPLDNRRSNLRICQQGDNARNREGHRLRRLANGRYLGVLAIGKNWGATICPKGERIYLGLYATAEDAARAYDIAARDHFGEYASLNFVDRVGEPPPVRKPRKPLDKPICRPRAKITFEIAREIRQALSNGERNKDVAARFGISTCNVSAIKTGREWKESVR